MSTEPKTDIPQWDIQNRRDEEPWVFGPWTEAVAVVEKSAFIALQLENKRLQATLKSLRGGDDLEEAMDHLSFVIWEDPTQFTDPEAWESKLEHAAICVHNIWRNSK